MLAASNQHRFKKIPLSSWLIAFLALLAGIAVTLFVSQTEYELWLLAAMGGGLFVLVLTTRPTWSLYILVFMIYTRLSDVLVNFHGAPSIAKFYIPLLILLIMVRWVLYNDQLQGLERTIIIIAYGFIGLASMLYAADPTRVTGALSDFVKDAIIVFVVITLINTGKTLHHVIWTLLAAGIFLGTISVYQQLTGTFDNPYWGFGQAKIGNIVGETSDYRVGGPGLGANTYAQFLLILVPLALDRMWREQSQLGRVLAIYALSVCLLTIFFTFSRGAFVALVMVLAIMLVYRPPRLRFIILTVLIGILLLRFLPNQYTARLLTLTQLRVESTEQNLADSSFRGRFSENASAWMMFNDHPILGVGLNNFKVHYQSYARNLGLDPRREERSPHSFYLEIASELGVMGLIWLAALQWVAFRSLYEARRDFIAAQKPQYADIALAFGVGILSFLFTGIFLHVSHPRYLWLIYGIALAMPHAARSELALQENSRAVATE
jgi:O-antigen ligase